ncbi:hypothetical protein [Bacillus pseudomycoides]|uniref:hypothetical protein n=1 Tax=Bacillus pseudomycoides TaxID=64104 RepID=UPI000BEBE35D|nr:hypothetical protein [Bacillus pseudomycoides]PEE40874.1 hypothetical protein COO02_13475 [Bacillus pseudomycoides]PEI82689.1 hypothetical protein CN679_27665 [Bacillus pseudomycoides]PGA79177.1 hypothetical protein COL91_28325 [Bacillus pseudomycoides]PHF35295.1 hypothetical protein COF72_26190 [Bacillus pseudomycoides]
MTWLSFFIGYRLGFTLCLLMMIQVVKAKEEEELDDIVESAHKEMEQLRAIMDEEMCNHDWRIRIGGNARNMPSLLVCVKCGKEEVR